MPLTSVAVDLKFWEKKMKCRAISYSSLLLTTLLLGACATTQAPGAGAKVEARSASTVSGNVTFSDLGGSVQVDAQFVGLTPGEHGFHVHEAGDCSAADASSAKGHYNPTGQRHGHHESKARHGGDMPNLTANAQGEARLSAELKGLTVSELIGRSVVVHADPDDYMSQPAGNSGKRVGCGVIAAR
jgi:Cu-Zn family superoxide dismutase